MNQLLSMARFFSNTVFGFISSGTEYKWTVRDHLLIAELFTIIFLLAAFCCVVYSLPHGHDYVFAFKSGIGAVASGLIALHSWNQWFARRHAA